MKPSRNYILIDMLGERGGRYPRTNEKCADDGGLRIDLRTELVEAWKGPDPGQCQVM